jgi:hypothetical protein
VCGDNDHDDLRVFFDAVWRVMMMVDRASFQWAEETLEYLYQQGYTSSKARTRQPVTYR